MPAPSNPQIHINLDMEALIEHALLRGEGELASNQAFSATTGNRTGRSPKDRFIVKDSLTEQAVDWGNINQAISPEVFDNLYARAEKYLSQREHYVSNLQVGADPTYYVPIKVITELAWHHLFSRNLFIHHNHQHGIEPTWTLLCAPGLKVDPARDGTHSDGVIILNFTKRCVLIIGMLYAGEMKKAMFSVLNFLLTKYDVLPMHCAANVGNASDVALFFGLSGTGKTTLSADPERRLIGDDEHGWSHERVFNFEGGCYAKCINLSYEQEPVIWDAIRYGSIMENVVLDVKTKQPIYSDGSLTQNTRVAYPREYIPNRVEENYASQPKTIIFLSCDLYGVLPPVSLLTKEQAAYYFLSGYTALVGSTEVGQTQAIKPTFSTCFGAPFFPRSPNIYAELLLKRITHANSQVYLVNTGWSGGAYGQGGKRFDLPVTRSILNAIFSGEVQQKATHKLDNFNFMIPHSLNNIDNKLLNPELNYSNRQTYEENKKILIGKFIANFSRFKVARNVVEAGPG